MTKGSLVTTMSVLISLAISDAPLRGQTPMVTFSAGVELVRVSAVVRDRKGRVVKDLTADDFEVFDGGELREISDFHTDSAGISVAFLFDLSGSMEGRTASAREAAQYLLDWFDTGTDESAVFAFDTRLEELTPFSADKHELPAQLAAMRPFGATSLHDAIARTAEQLDGREGRRRAVVVFTDGNDTSSRLTPAEVSGIASAIDVPVYVVGVVSAIDDPSTDIGTTGGHSAFEGPLFNLAAWTGGNVFVASSARERSKIAEEIIEELRHQYLIAFESIGSPGWHPLVVRVRDGDHVIRARGGYLAGQSSPALQ
jgi:Ca-activated chloride channel family protein